MVTRFHFQSFDFQARKITLVDPAVLDDAYKDILRKMNGRKLHEEGNDYFIGTKVLSRQEMEIENSLYAGSRNETSKVCKKLVYNAKTSGNETSLDHPMNRLDDIMKEMLQRKKKQCMHDNRSKEEKVEYNPSVHNVVVPIPLIEIQENKLSIDEIKDIQRFKDYSPGSVSKVLMLLIIRDL